VTFVLDLEISLKHQRSFEDEILSVKLRTIIVLQNICRLIFRNVALK